MRRSMRSSSLPSFSTTTGRFSTRPTARMPGSGGLMMAKNSRMPYMPRLVRLKVPPCTPRGAASFRDRGRPAHALASQRAQRLSIGIAHDGGDQTLAFVERHGDAGHRRRADDVLSIGNQRHIGRRHDAQRAGQALSTMSLTLTFSPPAA